MEKENNPIYERNTLEFVTVALEFCTFVENAGNTGLFDFLDKAVKILPLLYLKATLLPEAEEDEDAEPELTVTEDMYESVRNRIAGLLGEKDSYLETFHPDSNTATRRSPPLSRRIWPMFTKIRVISSLCSVKAMKKLCSRQSYCVVKTSANSGDNNY